MLPLPPSPPPSAAGTDETAVSQASRTTLEERKRSLELAKYFSASSIVPTAKQPPLDSPRAPPNNTLIALAQLGCYRLGTNRAFISLIDRSHQYIIGEATRATSLLQPGLQSTPVGDPNDDIYLGFRALELSFGVCPQTMQVFTSDDRRIDTPNISADRTRYVIRDFCADPHFRERPYVTGFPHMRSYAEVPLKSETGYVIGSYCVVDTKPRDFDRDEIAILNEVSACIMNHLDLLKTKVEFERVEGLVRGIGSYVAGYPSFQEQQPKSLPSRVLGLAPTTSQGETGPSRPKLTRAESSAESSAAPSTHTKSPSPPETPVDIESAQESFNGEAFPFGSAFPRASGRTESGILVSDDVRTTFSRASNVISKSMDMQQVTFLDARHLERSNNPGRSTSMGEPVRTPPAAPEPDSPGCATLEYSVQAEGRQDAVSGTAVFNISEALLQRLLKRYPFGHVFSYDDLGIVPQHYRSNYQDREHPSRPDFDRPSLLELDTEEADAAILFEAVQHARSIIFLPLWDFGKETWFAATIGWTVDPTRILDVGDLNYLSAFGNSIMAETARLEASALSRAKSDFISSVSHELRSPLHGILAGTELLRSSETSRADEAMLDTIASCGNMLLDTIDHLLDFAKINSLTGRQRMSSVSGPEQPSDTTLTRLAVVDLAELVQDVVEGVHLGSSRATQKHGLNGDTVGTASDTHTTATTSSPGPGDTIVLIHIEPGVDWSLETEVGAWKRIVMNLFGNAMKYTDGGRIEVTLRLIDKQDNSPGARSICLQINDTGRGMSTDYLKHRIFTPFAQENDLSVGTGLGLSIVHHLVNSLGGSIDVQSELGKGTQISVAVPFGDKVRTLPAERQLSQLSLTKSSLHPPTQLQGRTLYLLGTKSKVSNSSLPMNGSAHENAANHGSDVHDLFAKIAGRYLRMTVSFECPPGTSDDNPHFVLQQQHRNVNSEWTLRYSDPMSKTTPSEFREDKLSEHIREIEVGVSQPFGRRKLAAALSETLAGEGKPRTIPKPLDSKRTKLVKTDVVSTNGAEVLVNGIRPVHLLLVDDNNLNLRVLSTCVKQIGCTFTQATNGLEAVEAYKTTTQPYDICFMDISMPQMDGCTATRVIRAYEADMKLPRMPIVALTALGAEEAKQEAFAAGVDLYISKPVKMKDVRALVASEIAQEPGP